MTDERGVEKLVVHHLGLLDRLIRDLRKTKIPVRSEAYTYEEHRIKMVLDYFRKLKRLDPKGFDHCVTIYEKVCRKYLKLPPIQRRVFPLLCPRTPEHLSDRHYVKDLPPLSNYPTPRSGGRKPSHRIQEINELIRKCKGRGLTHRQICGELDKAGYVPPWTQETNSWVRAYKMQSLRKRIHTRMSKCGS